MYRHTRSVRDAFPSGCMDRGIGWRAAVFLGATLGLISLYLRRFRPESPRWLMTHGRVREAEAVVAGIERGVRREGHALAPVAGRIRLHSRRSTPLLEVARTLLKHYRSRTLLGLALMTSPAFLYNAIFFS